MFISYQIFGLCYSVPLHRYVKRITSPGLMQDTGCLGMVHWDDPEGWDGREVGGGFRMGNICTLIEDSSQCMAKPIQYCKVK